MQVVTLNETQLFEHACELANKVGRSMTSPYDALVAIRRGGSYVCDALCESFPRDRYGERFDISLQRPSTKNKNGLIGFILRKLPYSLLNVMRIAEAWWLTRLKNQMPRDVKELDLPTGLLGILRSEKPVNILIVDDAIDSGNTLFTIVSTLKKINPETAIRIAVITVTTPKPIQDADYYLYHNGTLIRFPWSNDFKKE